MSIYAIGDIQGCFKSFQALLHQIQFNPSQDKLWLAGDLVNRGPRSLEVLQWLFDHQDALQIILGNHDLHLLGCWLGMRPLGKRSTIQDILNYSKKEELLDWLRKQPLIHAENGFVMVHAGIYPGWDLDQALNYGQQLQAALQTDLIQDILAGSKQEGDLEWEEAGDEIQKLRFFVQAFTRMRLVHAQGGLEFSYTDSLTDKIPQDYSPWFSWPKRKILKETVLFGHWAALGFYPDNKNKVVCLDSGCVWKQKLTAYRLEDGQVYQQEYIDS